MRSLGVLLVVAMLSACSTHVGVALYVIAAGGMDPIEREPELDPGRPISEQDCTQPVDYTSGNIRCK